MKHHTKLYESCICIYVSTYQKVPVVRRLDFELALGGMGAQPKYLKLSQKGGLKDSLFLRHLAYGI